MQMLLGSAAVAIRTSCVYICVCVCVYMCVYGIAAGTAITPRIQGGIIHDTYAAMRLSTSDTNKFPMTILIGDFPRYWNALNFTVLRGRAKCLMVIRCLIHPANVKWRWKKVKINTSTKEKASFSRNEKVSFLFIDHHSKLIFVSFSKDNSLRIILNHLANKFNTFIIPRLLKLIII